MCGNPLCKIKGSVLNLVWRTCLLWLSVSLLLLDELQRELNGKVWLFDLHMFQVLLAMLIPFLVWWLTWTVMSIAVYIFLLAFLSLWMAVFVLGNLFFARYRYKSLKYGLLKYTACISFTVTGIYVPFKTFLCMIFSTLSMSVCFGKYFWFD